MHKFKNQKELFLWVWENRPHYSELTGVALLPPGNFKWHWQFLHVLPKGTYPKFKLNPDNIMLGTADEHEKQEQYEAFNEKKNELRAKYRELYEVKRKL